MKETEGMNKKKKNITGIVYNPLKRKTITRKTYNTTVKSTLRNRTPP